MFTVAIVSVVWFTSTSWRRDRVFAPYRHLRRAVAEFIEHYHSERNHQGLGNGLIAGLPAIKMTSRVRRHPRLGGLLNFYERAA